MDLSGLPREHFSVVLADPPWSFKAWATYKPLEDGSMTRATERHYPVMDTKDICAMPVAGLMLPDSVLVLWVSWPMLMEALEVIKAWGFCVGTGTKVLTSDLRWVEAERLNIGDELLCFDDLLDCETGRRYFKRGRVLSTGTEPLPCHRIKLADGRELIASNEHRWLAHGGQQYNWATAPQMMGDYGGRRVRGWYLPEIAPVAMVDRTYEGGFLSAAFDSEGSLGRQRGGLCFSQNPNVLWDRVTNLLGERGFNFGVHAYPEYHSAQQLTISSRFESLRFLMQYRPPRLLQNWSKAPIENYSLYNLPRQEIVEISDAGLQEVVTLQTDTGTYIAEGFGAHNTYKTCAFCWIKGDARQMEFFQEETKAEMKLGYWTRANSEVALLATRGKPTRIDAGVRQAIIEPAREHSRKPECIYERLERLVSGPRLELFARTTRPGWTASGNQTTKFAPSIVEPDKQIDMFEKIP